MPCMVLRHLVFSMDLIFSLIPAILTDLVPRCRKDNIEARPKTFAMVMRLHMVLCSPIHFSLTLLKKVTVSIMHFT